MRLCSWESAQRSISTQAWCRRLPAGCSATGSNGSTGWGGSPGGSGRGTCGTTRPSWVRWLGRSARSAVVKVHAMAGGTSEPLPRPPRDLAGRVFSLNVGSDPERSFDEIGAQTKRQVVSLLPDDWSFEGKRILDFGCGAGRTLRHFAEEAKVAEIWGADLDEPSIKWMEENVCPPLHAWHSAALPPLGLEHGTFDLIYTVSVFTHLTDNSLLWLLELHRLLKPDGILIISYMGRWNSAWFAREPWVEDRIGMNVLYNHRDWDSGGPAVLISDWWLREHWGRAFEIEHIDPQFQNYSWAVLRKKDVKLTSEDLERLSDDPREVVALRHNINQLQREITHELDHQKLLHAEELRAQAEEYERRLAEAHDRIRVLEGSKAQRLAQPLQRAAGALRSRSDRK